MIPRHLLNWLIVLLCTLALVNGCRAGIDGPAPHSPAKSGPVRSANGDAAALYYFVAAQMKVKAGDLAEARWYFEQAIAQDPGAILPRLELAGLYMAQQQSDKALVQIQQILADHPDHIDALIMAGRIYQQGKLLSAAKDAYEKVVGSGADDPNPYLHLGGIYWDENDPVNAGRVFELMVGRFPQSYAAHYFHGKALLAQGELGPAEEAFKRSLALEPSLEEPYQELIRIYQVQNRPDQMIRTYRTLLAYYPDNTSAALELAIFYHQNGEPESGRQLLYDLGHRIESDPAILVYLFERYYENKQFDITTWAVEGMLEAAPGSSELHYLAGLAYDGLNNTPTALQHLARVRPRSRFYSNATVHRALLLHDAGQIDDAIRVITEALAHDANQASFHYYLGAFYEEQDRYAEALEALTKAVAIEDSNARYFFRMGVIYDKLNRPQDVIDAMRRSLAIEAEDAEALNYLGYTYAELGIELQEAEALIQRALHIKPDDGYITDSLAWVYYKMGRYEDALAWMKKAVALVPDDPTILEHMGDILHQLGQTDQALDYYRRSYTLKPNGREALGAKIRSLQPSDGSPSGNP